MEDPTERNQATTSETFGFAAGPVIAGRIFDRTASYTGALLLFVAFAIVSMLAMRATSPLAEETTRIDTVESASAEPIISS